MLSEGKKLGTVVSYIDSDSAQYTHLISFMLCYVSINLLSMVNRFPDTEMRVATDSIYINEKHLAELDKFVTTSNGAWGTWRVKKEALQKYYESADVEIKDEYRKSTMSTILSLPSVYDPITRHRTVYLNGPGCCGKTTHDCVNTNS